MNNSSQAIKHLRDLSTIRERSQQLYERALNNKSPYFGIDASKIGPCCDFVLSLARESNPSLDVPFHSRWRHFSVGNIDRIDTLKQQKTFPSDQKEQGRLWYELTLISVLLDAGAGNQWRYLEKSTQQHWSRSEGLAVASFDMFLSGLFSSSKTTPLQADYEGLHKISTQCIANGMQVTSENPLSGLEGRAKLINSLASVIKSKPASFANTQRLGGLYDHVIEHASVGDKLIDAPKVLAIILETFSDIWPGRVSLDNENLGDVWHHSAVKGDDKTNGLIPFHKLSQWLTYSLLEPLQWQGYQIQGLEKMTGLAEYRNGGLFIDLDVIIIKDQTLRTVAQAPESEAIIEWRALTICLLDKLWQDALEKTQKSPEDFPLVSFLEAGTWKAGRVTAFKNNPNGQPPIAIISDGTVF